MTASERTSKGQGLSGHILERLEDYAEEHPEATEYRISSELEAEQILLAMAATIKHTSSSIRNKMDKSLYLEIANKYRVAVIGGKALETFRAMTEEDQLELYGLKLTVTNIVQLN